VRREFRRPNLVIEQEGYEPLVIENKTSSTPDLAQLRRYAEGRVRRGDANPQLVPLSLIDPWVAGRHRSHRPAQARNRQ
jgi:hypothetical protein